MRIEIGPKDMKNNQVMAIRRDTSDRITIKRVDVLSEIQKLLDTIQLHLFKKSVSKTLFIYFYFF